MRTCEQGRTSLVRGESRHHPGKRVSNRRILACSGRKTTAVFARGVLCTFWPQKVPKTPRQMPAPTSSRLTLAPGDYSRGRTHPVPFARAFSRAFVSRLRHWAGIVRGNSVFSAGKRSEHANMRTGANISCSRRIPASPLEAVLNRRILACSGERTTDSPRARSGRLHSLVLAAPAQRGPEVVPAKATCGWFWYYLLPPKGSISPGAHAAVSCQPKRRQTTPVVDCE